MDVNTLSITEIRDLVRYYYAIQQSRTRHLRQSERHPMLGIVDKSSQRVEKEIDNLLKAYMHQTPLGAWIDQLSGLSYVAAAGLYAYIADQDSLSIDKLWSNANVLDRKAAHYYDSDLTSLVYRTIDRFLTSMDDPKQVYGRLYGILRERLLKEDYISDVEILLKARKSIGRVFLWHWYQIYYFLVYQKLPELYMDNVIPIPNMALIPGLEEAYHASRLHDHE